MNYAELVEMCNSEFTPLWDKLSEEEKIEFALTRVADPAF
jgi:hypothetical protein